MRRRSLSTKRCQSKKRLYLKLDSIMPWQELNHSIEPFYKSDGIYSLDTMLRIYILQLLNQFTDDDIESELHDSIAFRSFARLGSFTEPTPGKADICKFRSCLEDNHLISILSELINDRLHDKNIEILFGKYTDPAIIRTCGVTSE